MTQTTAERLLALIANNQQTIRTGSIKLIDHGRAANLIAAEIDGLAAERDGVRDIYAAQGAILAAARMEIESLKANVSGWQVKAGDAGNKLVRSEQEAQRLTRMRDFERDAAGTMADQYSILAEERNALKAEVERLRPAAEAWELLEHMYHNTGSSLAASYTKACIDKAARASAAKVTP